MGKITFIEHDGAEHVVALEAGSSLMQIAMDHGIPGIDADCGGSCACGTCHVIVEAAWAGQLGAMAADEQQLLDMTPERASTSRLACQVQVTQDMDGMLVRLPEFQM